MENDNAQKMGLDLVDDRFFQHLQQEGNDFVILSGKYGIGKTFFLEHFFEGHGEVFQAVFISPLKYAVNSSENIFELIKLDIVRDLMRRGKIQREEEKEFDWWRYVSEHELDVAKDVLRSLAQIDPVGTAASVAADGVVKYLDRMRRFDNEAQRSRVDLYNSDLQLSLFLDRMFERVGHFGEMDVVTSSIMEVLQTGRDMGEGKWCLVIDDFDRIDPDHIFRILNVLSAHREDRGGGFKFGFDKVILVCDFENLGHLYRYRYGPEANFKGYIDKFYSREVFSFSHTDAVEQFFFAICPFEFPAEVRDLVAAVILGLFLNGPLTLRMLVKVKDFVPLDGEMVVGEVGVIRTNRKVSLKVGDSSLIQIFPILNLIFGNLLDFTLALEGFGAVNQVFTRPEITAHVHSLAFLKLGFRRHNTLDWSLPSAKRTPWEVKCGLYRVSDPFGERNIHSKVIYKENSALSMKKSLE